jgi:hypothetical protein
LLLIALPVIVSETPAALTPSFKLISTVLLLRVKEEVSITRL